MSFVRLGDASSVASLSRGLFVGLLSGRGFLPLGSGLRSPLLPGKGILAGAGAGLLPPIIGVVGFAAGAASEVPSKFKFKPFALFCFENVMRTFACLGASWYLGLLRSSRSLLLFLVNLSFTIRDGLPPGTDGVWVGTCGFEVIVEVEDADCSRLSVTVGAVFVLAATFSTEGRAGALISPLILADPLLPTDPLLLMILIIGFLVGTTVDGCLGFGYRSLIFVRILLVLPTRSFPCRLSERFKNAMDTSFFL